MQAKGASPLVCNVYQQCITGIGDKYLDVIMGAALSQLAGCKMPVVHMQQHWSSHTHDRMVKFDRNSNFSRVVSSSSGEPLFVTDQVCPSSNLSQWTNGSCVRKGWHLPLVVFYPCGAKRPSWIMESLLQRRDTPRNVSLAAVYTVMGRMAHSIRVLDCKGLPHDIGQRVGVHLRRGDKVRDHHDEWFAIYHSVPAWLIANGHRHVFLASDDQSFLRDYASRLSEAGFDVALPASGADALDDVCALMRTRLVMMASLHSNFVALSAVVARRRMVVFNGTATSLLDDFHRGWIEAGLLDVEIAPMVQLQRESKGLVWNLPKWSV